MANNMNVKLAKIDISKRKQAEQKCYDIMTALDPSGVNTKKYREMFAKMSNTEFVTFMNTLWKDDYTNYILDIVDFDRELTMANIEKAAKLLGIPLEEYVMYPHLNMDTDNPVVSKVPCIVMYIIDKRMQQMAQKKNSTSIHTSDRSAVTGQVVGDDKNGRSSDVENAALITLGAVNSAREFNGFRADGLTRKSVGYSDAATTGSVSLEKVEDSAGIGDHTILNTLSVLYLGMGIATDLVQDSIVMNKTLKEINRKK